MEDTQLTVGLVGGRRRWTDLVGTTAGVFLALVLLTAAWTKAVDPVAFAEQIRLEGLDLLLPAAAVAILAIALEAGLGTALLIGMRRLWVLLPTAALTVFFLFLTGRAYWLTARGLRSESAACGCFGNLLSRSPAQAFWQDLLLLVPPLLLAFVGRPGAGSRPGLRSGVVALVTLGFALLAWRAPALPLDDLATRLRPGVVVSELCAGGGQGRSVCLDSLLPELEEGRHMVVIAELEDRGFQDEVDRLSDFSIDGTGPRLWVLSPATPEQLRAFQWRWAPAFELREVPAELLRPLYRTLPRSFLIDDGRVVETWVGLPPLARG